MKRLSFILLVVFSLGKTYAQLPIPANNTETQPVPEKKLDYSLTTGTSYLYSPGYAKGSTFYIAPEFKVNVSPKFKVNAGVFLSQNRFTYSAPVNLPGTSSVVLRQSPSYSGTVYATGTYSVNSKLLISGSILKDFSPNGSYPNQAYNNNLQMMSLGVQYKISDHMSIGAGMNMIQSNGYNPYTGYNPYSGYYYAPGSPFGLQGRY